ncbi:hypothetical protein GCM10023224_05450 [Streptomonospora halophila]|uniref:Uncharacterized protein n=1 Tax=Streptomonospora halophila TaxID=427369 RepID=A0ABP9G567_9ACTN
MTPAEVITRARAAYQRVHGHTHQWDAITAAANSHTDPAAAADALAQATPTRADIVTGGPWGTALHALDEAAGLDWPAHRAACTRRYQDRRTEES